MGLTGWRIFLVLVFGFGIAAVIFFILLLQRMDWVAREAREAAREQETQRLKAKAEELSKQLHEAQREHADVSKLTERAPQHADGRRGFPKTSLAVSQALAKAKTEALQSRAQEVKALLTKLEKEATGWGPRVQEILRGEPGKRLANNLGRVEQLAALLDKERLSPAMAQSWSKQMTTLLEPLEVAIQADDKFFAPEETLVRAVEALARNAQDRLQEYEQDRSILETMVQDSAAQEIGTRTLGQALEEHRSAKDRKKAAEIAVLKEAALRDLVQKTAQAEIEAARIVEEEKAKQLLQKAGLEKSRLQQETELTKRQADKDRLRRLAEDPAVQAKYQALLQAGYMQFTSSPRGLVTRGDRPLPASLGNLSQHGWLRDTETFAKALSRQPNRDYNAFNDRPTLPYPQTDAEWKEIERLLEEFRLVSPLWVEMKLLRP